LGTTDCGLFGSLLSLLLRGFQFCGLRFELPRQLLLPLVDFEQAFLQQTRLTGAITGRPTTRLRMKPADQAGQHAGSQQQNKSHRVSKAASTS